MTNRQGCSPVEAGPEARMLRKMSYSTQVHATGGRRGAVARRIFVGIATSLALLASLLPVWADELHIVEISLVDGVAQGKGLSAPLGRAPTLVLTEGERVDLRWTSDRDVVLHFHGYDLEARIGPERDAAMVFEARAAGRFPVETHDTDGRYRAVLYIEIYPE